MAWLGTVGRSLVAEGGGDGWIVISAVPNMFPSIPLSRVGYIVLVLVLKLRGLDIARVRIWNREVRRSRILRFLQDIVRVFKTNKYIVLFVENHMVLSSTG